MSSWGKSYADRKRSLKQQLRSVKAHKKRKAQTAAARQQRHDTNHPNTAGVYSRSFARGRSLAAYASRLRNKL